MTAIETETESEVIEHLDLETAVPCENRFGCDRAAQWVLHYACCTRTWCCCDPCKGQLIEVLRTKTVVGIDAVCPACRGHNVYPKDYRWEAIP